MKQEPFMTSLAELIRTAAAEHGSRPVILRKGEGRTLVPESYAEMGEQVATVAAGLVAAGVAPGENIVLVSEDRPEWVYADGGVLSAGAVTVPLYPSLPAEQVQPLVARVRARIAIVEDAAQLAKLDRMRAELPLLERIYVFEAGDVPADHPLAVPWSALVAEGRERRAEVQPEVDRRVAALGLDSPATIIFTSGTTGVPKGAVLTHGNLLANVEAAQPRIRLRHDDTTVTFLPLSHVFMRMVIFLGIRQGAATLFTEGLRHLGDELRLVRPTMLMVVPRMLELLRDRIRQGLKAKTGLEAKGAEWAMGVADAWSRAYVEDREPGLVLSGEHAVAEAKVFKAIREQLGFDRLRAAVSGGAALPPEVGRWFYGIGVTVLQGYGLTETAPAIACNDPDGPIRFDSIGPPLPGIEVRIAPDGELLTRGPCVMQGYYEMPEETAEAIDAEGWFHTGDLAEWNDVGHLRITDRKKNILVLANGKKVAPTPIEGKLAESPLIDQVMLVGDGQDVVTALIVPACDALRQAMVAAGGAVPDGDDPNWLSSPAAERPIRAELDRLSDGLATFERPRRQGPAQRPAQGRAARADR
jgi:long-chain acyl-CoA synthetase